MMIKNNTYIRLCRAKDMLRESEGSKFSIPDAAREAQISTYHFIRLFKSTFGVTPHEFRTRVRMEKAKELLVIGNHSVTDLCMELGYSSVGSFTSLFVKHAGLPPSAYRRQARSLVQVPGSFPQEFFPYCFATMYGGR